MVGPIHRLIPGHLINHKIDHSQLNRLHSIEESVDSARVKSFVHANESSTQHISYIFFIMEGDLSAARIQATTSHLPLILFNFPNIDT